MKGHKKACKSGGGKMEHKEQESPESGAREYDEDLKTKPEARTNATKEDAEAEEMNKGGKAKKKNRGGVVKKNVGGVVGAAPKATAARAPRKAGGRAGGADQHPFSSAKPGTKPKGHSDNEID